MAVNTTVQVTLPQMGESVTEGTVLEWHKQEGDSVEADEILVEVSTDKVDAEVPSPASGTVVKIHAAEGDTVNVGAVLAEIATENGAAPAAAAATEAPVAEPAANGDEPEAEAPSETQAEAPIETHPEAPPAAEGDGQAGATGGQIVDIVTPAGGESVTEGTILEWSVKVGDAVEDGQAVVEISTDKVDMELPAPTAGTITEILAEEGETVTVG
ncbi:MAG TPA: biotin/lipoyl-containing protein, partial [Solirubrobacteraceae bacterium]